jgi:hypothetical protein
MKALLANGFSSIHCMIRVSFVALFNIPNALPAKAQLQNCCNSVLAPVRRAERAIFLTGLGWSHSIK